MKWRIVRKIGKCVDAEEEQREEEEKEEQTRGRRLGGDRMRGKG